jgi:hypothetical protein
MVPPTGAGPTALRPGMAPWNAVSTVSTTGSEAVADHAETPARCRSQRRAACRRRRARGARGRGPVVDAALRTMATALRDRTADPLAANAADVEAAERGGMTGGLLDRLRLTPERLADMAVQLGGARRHPLSRRCSASSASCPRASGCSSGACPSG